MALFGTLSLQIQEYRSVDILRYHAVLAGGYSFTCCVKTNRARAKNIWWIVNFDIYIFHIQVENALGSNAVVSEIAFS